MIVVAAIAFMTAIIPALARAVSAAATEVSI
jgi:hypothetical protein